MEKGHFGDQSSDSDPYESGQVSSRDDFSEGEIAPGAQSDDNGDTLSIHADNESDSDRFDPTEGESSFRSEGGMTSYCREHLTDESINRNILDDAPVPLNAFL